MKVFISYRRDDTAIAAKLLHDELARHFGTADVFMDIDDVGYGDDFVAAIDRQLTGADVVVVVIGPQWLQILQRRMRGDDWVREEVRQALARRAATGKPRVLPALVEGAGEPGDGLPPELQPLRKLNMLRIDPRALNQSLNAFVEAVQNKRFDRLAYETRRRWHMRMAAVAAGVVVFVSGWVSLFDFAGLDTRAATATMLASATLPGAAVPPWSNTVVLAAIDEKTVAAVGRPFGPSWRAEHAQFLRAAAAAGARTVAFDVTFAADGPADADAALAEALAALKGRLPVVIAVHELRDEAPRIAPRLAGLASWGIACAGQRLGLARSLPLAVDRPQAEPIASLALAAFSGGGRIKAPDPVLRRVDFVRSGEPAHLRFFAYDVVRQPQPGCEAIRPGDRVAAQLIDPGTLPPLDRPPQRVAYEDVLRGEPQARAALSGRIVLVGLLLAGQDETGIGGGRRWGAELIAAQIDAMARSSAILPLPWPAQAVIATTLALLGAMTIARIRERRRWIQAAAVAATGAVFVGAVIIVYRAEQLLVGVLYGLVALVLGAWLADRLSLKGPS